MKVDTRYHFIQFKRDISANTSRIYSRLYLMRLIENSGMGVDIGDYEKRFY